MIYSHTFHKLNIIADICILLTSVRIRICTNHAHTHIPRTMPYSKWQLRLSRKSPLDGGLILHRKRHRKRNIKHRNYSISFTVFVIIVFSFLYKIHTIRAIKIYVWFYATQCQNVWNKESHGNIYLIKKKDCQGHSSPVELYVSWNFVSRTQKST